MQINVAENQSRLTRTGGYSTDVSSVAVLWVPAFAGTTVVVSEPAYP